MKFDLLTFCKNIIIHNSITNCYPDECWPEVECYPVCFPGCGGCYPSICSPDGRECYPNEGCTPDCNPNCNDCVPITGG